MVGSLNTVFFHSYKAMFEDLGHKVFIGNSSDVIEHENEKDGFNFNSKYREKPKNKLRRLASRLNFDNSNFFWKIIEFKEYHSKLPEEKVNEIANFIIKKNIDLVYCFWGTTLKKEVFALSKLKFDYNLSFKMVLCVNTYPVRYVLPKDVNKNSMGYLNQDVKYFNFFDDVICPTKKMAFLLKNRLKISSSVYIRPDFLSHRYFSNDDNQKIVKNSIIFLGNVDFSQRTLDDVSKTIVSIADRGIDVWVQEPCCISHEHVHTFPPFSYEEIALGMLGNFIKQFSASLVIYNDYNNLRTSLGYPTRFALATLGRGYILLPKGTFDGIEETMCEKEFGPIKLFEDIDQIEKIIFELDNLAKPDFGDVFSSYPEFDMECFLKK